jgi:hypothetical protein
MRTKGIRYFAESAKSDIYKKKIKVSNNIFPQCRLVAIFYISMQPLTAVGVSKVTKPVFSAQVGLFTVKNPTCGLRDKPTREREAFCVRRRLVLRPSRTSVYAHTAHVEQGGIYCPLLSGFFRMVGGRFLFVC